MWYFVSSSTMSGGRMGSMTCLRISARSCSMETLSLCWRGDDHGIQPHGLAVHVLHADLGLAVGAQVVQQPGAADFAQLGHQLVGQHDGQRHQLGGLVAGVAEHQALVARAAGVHAHGDVGRLALERADHAAGVAVEAVGRVRVADVPDDLPGDPGHVHVGGGRDLARHDAQARGDQHLAGHAARGVILHHRVQHGVGDLVRHLVGMPLGDRLRGE